MIRFKYMFVESTMLYIFFIKIIYTSILHKFVRVKFARDYTFLFFFRKRQGWFGLSKLQFFVRLVCDRDCCTPY